MHSKNLRLFIFPVELRPWNPKQKESIWEFCWRTFLLRQTPSLVLRFSNSQMNKFSGSQHFWFFGSKKIFFWSRSCKKEVLFRGCPIYHFPPQIIENPGLIISLAVFLIKRNQSSLYRLSPQATTTDNVVFLSHLEISKDRKLI